MDSESLEGSTKRARIAEVVDATLNEEAFLVLGL